MKKPINLLLAVLLFLSFYPVVVAGNFEDGLSAYNKKDFVTALRLWEEEAEKGNGSAQFNLGLMHFNGQGTQVNLQVALKWIRMAAEQGQVDAEFRLAMMYAEGQGTARDLGIAKEWFLKVAEKGDSDAQFNLGLMYGQEHLSPKKVQKAIFWLRKAAEQGNKNAQEVLEILMDDDVKKLIASASYILGEALKLEPFDSYKVAHICLIDGKKVMTNRPCPGKIAKDYHGTNFEQAAESCSENNSGVTSEFSFKRFKYCMESHEKSRSYLIDKGSDLNILKECIDLNGMLYADVQSCYDKKIKGKREKIIAPGEKIIAPGEKIIAPGEKIIAPVESCYSLGFKFGKCFTQTMAGQSCSRRDDVSIPARCRNLPETESGMAAGAKSVNR